MDVNQAAFGERERKIRGVIPKQANVFTFACQILDRVEFDFSIKKPLEEIRGKFWFVVADFVSFGLTLVVIWKRTVKLEPWMLL